MSQVVWNALQAAATRHSAIWHRRTPWHIGLAQPGLPLHCEVNAAPGGGADVVLHLERDDTEGHGWSKRRYRHGLSADGTPSKSMLASLDHVMRKASGIQRRNAAIRSAGDTIDFPAPWAFVTSGTVAAAMRLAGYDLDCLSRCGANRPKYRPAAAEFRLSFPLKPDCGFGLDPEIFVESGGMVRAKSLGLLRPTGGKKFVRVADIDTMTGRTSVFLHGVHLPETAILALRGRPLSEIVEHELFDAMPKTRVTWIEPEPTGTVLRYADVRATLADVPPRHRRVLGGRRLEAAFPERRRHARSAARRI